MGIGCPFTRPYKNVEEKGESQAQDSQSTSERKLIVSLRNEEKILRLAGPLDLYYKRAGELRPPLGLKLILTNYISTKQSCIVLVVPKTPRRNSPEFKNALFDKLSKLDHPHVLRMYEMLEDSKSLYIVSEVFEQGQLEEYISQGGPFSESLAATAIQQVLSVMAYGHSLGIVHGSISARSVVVKSEPSPASIIIKVSGFENTDLIEEADRKVGSVFDAPEGGSLTEKSDIWSCGVLLVYMLTGKFEVPSFQMPNRVSFQSESRSDFSPDLVAFLTSILNRKPKSRPTALKCLEHPWIQRCAEQRPLNSRFARSSLSRLRDNETPVSLTEALVRFIINRIIKDSEIAKLAEVFRTLDANGDGLISKEELLWGFQRMIPGERATDEVKRVIAKVDRNSNGMIDYSEFLMTAFSAEQLLSRENLKAAFATLDADRSGSITISELKRFFVLNSSTNIDQEWRRLISEFDTSGDGEIDYAEFEALMKKAYDG